MTVVLDATLGGASANSYIDVATADALMPLVASKARSDAWLALDVDTKTVALVRAVKILETYVDFDGQRVSEYQPLDWPRFYVYGPDRFIAFQHDELPSPVKEAQALMALAIGEGFDAAVEAAAPIDRLRISTLQIYFNNDRAARPPMLLPSEVMEKLRGFGDYAGASGMARAVALVRA